MANVFQSAWGTLYSGLYSASTKCSQSVRAFRPVKSPLIEVPFQVAIYNFRTNFGSVHELAALSTRKRPTRTNIRTPRAERDNNWYGPIHLWSVTPSFPFHFTRTASVYLETIRGESHSVRKHERETVVLFRDASEPVKKLRVLSYILKSWCFFSRFCAFSFRSILLAIFTRVWYVRRWSDNS